MHRAQRKKYSKYKNLCCGGMWSLLMYCRNGPDNHRAGFPVPSQATPSVSSSLRGELVTFLRMPLAEAKCSGLRQSGWAVR